MGRNNAYLKGLLNDMFDLAEFLTAMLKAFLECRQDTDASNAPEFRGLTFRSVFDDEPVAVRFAARRALSRQGKKQGFKRRARRKFVEQNLDLALEGLSREIDALRAS